MAFYDLSNEQKNEALRLARLCVDGAYQTRIKTEDTKRLMRLKIAGYRTYDIDINGRLWVE